MSENSNKTSREDSLRRQRERARRNRARKKEWVEWAQGEISNLSPDVDILSKQVPLLEKFVEWLEKQDSEKS